MTTTALSPPLVLIIGGDPRPTLESRLIAEGYRIAAAPSARNGFDLAVTLAPDLILLYADVPMATVVRLRGDPATHLIPVIPVG